jgi:DNA invertase Pin-like site-specific DNA recombinase
MLGHKPYQLSIIKDLVMTITAKTRNTTWLMAYCLSQLMSREEQMTTQNSMAPKFVAYVRVSTQRQGESGLGLQVQVEAIARHVGTGVLLATYTEVESGKNSARPQIAAALAHAKASGAILVIAKLDRLARSVAFISQVMESGVELVVCDMPFANRLTLQLMACVAEHEGAIISARVKAALGVAKARGVVLGGYRGVSPEAVRSAKADARADSLAPVIAELKASGLTSFAMLANALNERGVTTARGKAWTPSAVRIETLRMV